MLYVSHLIREIPPLNCYPGPLIMVHMAIQGLLNPTEFRVSDPKISAGSTSKLRGYFTTDGMNVYKNSILGPNVWPIKIFFNIQKKEL